MGAKISDNSGTRKGKCLHSLTHGVPRIKKTITIDLFLSFKKLGKCLKGLKGDKSNTEDSYGSL